MLPPQPTASQGEEAASQGARGEDVASLISHNGPVLRGAWPSSFFHYENWAACPRSHGSCVRRKV